MTVWAPLFSSYPNGDLQSSPTFTRFQPHHSAPARLQTLMDLHNFISSMLIRRIGTDMHMMVVRSLLSQEASSGKCQVVQTGNVCGCASVWANRSWGGSEICLISRQLSGQTDEAFIFCRSQAAPPRGLPFAAGSPDAHPRVLAGAESLRAPRVRA